MARRASDIAMDWIGTREEENELQRVINNLCARTAETILEAREKAGLTQAELADAADTSQSAIARLEDADYDGHSLRTLAKVAHAMGLDVSVIFHRTNERVRLASTSTFASCFQWTTMETIHGEEINKTSPRYVCTAPVRFTGSTAVQC